MRHYHSENCFDYRSYSFSFRPIHLKGHLQVQELTGRKGFFFLLRNFTTIQKNGPDDYLKKSYPKVDWNARFAPFYMPRMFELFECLKSSTVLIFLPFIDFYYSFCNNRMRNVFSFRLTESIVRFTYFTTIFVYDLLLISATKVD